MLRAFIIPVLLGASLSFSAAAKTVCAATVAVTIEDPRDGAAKREARRIIQQNNPSPIKSIDVFVISSNELPNGDTVYVIGVSYLDNGPAIIPQNRGIIVTVDPAGQVHHWMRAAATTAAAPEAAMVW